MDATPILSICLLALFTIGSFLGMYFFWKYRSNTAINARVPTLVVITVFFIWIWLFCDILSLILFFEGYQNFQFDLFLYILPLSSSLFWTSSRVWILISNFHLTSERNEQVMGLFSRNPYLSKLSFIASIWFVWMLVLAFICAVLAKEINDNNRTVFQLILIIFHFIVIFFQLVLIRNRRENFRIKYELSLLNISVMLGAVLHYILISIMDSSSYRGAATFILTLFCFVALLLSTVFPIKHVTAETQRIQNEKLKKTQITSISGSLGTSSLPTLEECLANSALLNSFRSFLAAEFSVENLWFIHAIQRLRQQLSAAFPAAEQHLYTPLFVMNLPSPAHVGDLSGVIGSEFYASQAGPYHRVVDIIMDRYINRESIMCVNISDETLKFIQDQIEELTELSDGDFAQAVLQKGVFNDAYRQVIDLLYSGSYTRWIFSKTFTDTVNRLKNEGTFEKIVVSRSKSRSSADIQRTSFPGDGIENVTPLIPSIQL